MTPSFSLSARGLCLDAPGGRPLVRGLSISLESERVALVGRNGVGKSSLLEVLSGQGSATQGELRVTGTRLLVPQQLDRPSQHIPQQSPGELRRQRLAEAQVAAPDLLLLDEPTQDLDRDGIQWLLDWLGSWRGALLVVSHDRRLLRLFQHFFIVSEAGCRHLSGSLEELTEELAKHEADAQRTYVRNLKRLWDKEQHNATVRRRRQRKKDVGRIRELRRAPSRALLNTKRSSAQKYQGKREMLQNERIADMRSWVQATRRALTVKLPLKLALPALPEPTGTPSISLRGVAAEAAGRPLFRGVDLAIERQRVAVLGGNGAGKSTLLELMLGERRPAAGSVVCDRKRVGYIAQHAANWRSGHSLLSKLVLATGTGDSEALAARLLAHQFPFALAERPLSSLSPGERVRAALICLFQRQPCPELLILDEPTDQLDFLGTRALEQVLSAWQGGLVVVSHDEQFLDSLDIQEQLELGLVIRPHCRPRLAAAI